MGQAERIARLRAGFLAVLAEYERAQRVIRPDLVAAYGTVLVVLDACLAIEEGVFATRDGRSGRVTADPDRAVMDRLREIAAARDLLGGAGRAAAPEVPA